MRKVRSWSNYKPKKIENQDYGKSLTVPDQSMSLHQLLYNYTRGMPLPQERQGEYLGDEYVPDFQSMDLSEIADYKMELQENIKELEAQIKASEKEAFEKRKAAKIAAEKARIRETLTEVNENVQSPENQGDES